MSIEESWHGSRRHDPTVLRSARPIHQFRAKRYDENYTLISDFEAIGDWTLTAGDSIVADTVNFREGSQGIRWRSINGVDTVAERTIGLNALGSHFTLWLHFEDLSDIASIFPSLELTAPWAKRATVDLRWWFIRPGWNKVGFSPADFVYAGGAVRADLAHVTKVRINVRSTGGNTADVVFDDFRMVRDRFAGKMTLRFDDGWANQYTEARARMDEYGFRGVDAVTTNLIGGAGYMTLDQLTHLQQRGWDIVSHSVTHTALTGLTPAEIEAQLWNSQRWLIENGFYKGSRFYIPPGGLVGDDVSILEQISKYYQAWQASEKYDTIPPENQLPAGLMKLFRGTSVIDTTILANVQAEIDKVKENQAWGTLLFHRIADAGATPRCPLALFQSIIDYIAAQGLEVVTFSDVFDELLGSTQGVYTQILEFGVQGVITAGATSYPCPGGGVAAQTANEIKIPVSRDGWLKNLRVRQRVASGAGGRTDIYTVRVNGADIDLTCTLDNVTFGNDLVHSARVSEGDEVSAKLVSNNGADVSADISVTVELELLM